MCTSVKIKAENGELFWGRTMDLDIPMFPNETGFYLPIMVTTLPKGKEIDSQINNWTSQYAAIGVGLKDSTILFDGVNEHGLAGDLQVLKECGFAKSETIKNNHKTPLLAEEFVSYMLTNYKAVSEIRKNFDQFMLLDQAYQYKGQAFHFPVHFSFVDETGDGIVLETLADGTFVSFNHIGVMTNSPRYDYHEINIRNYIGMSAINIENDKSLPNGTSVQPIEGGVGYGMFGLPGDYTSPSRFVRSFCLANALNSFDKESGINELYAIFRSVFVPKGLERSVKNQGISDYTRYWAGYDLTEKKVVIQSGESIAFTTKTLNSECDSIVYEEINVTA